MGCDFSQALKFALEDNSIHEKENAVRYKNAF
jgi:hypothetical protein